MQKERESRDNMFESNNAFGGFGDFGGFGFHRSKMPSLFGNRDPFDDPFFARPVDSMFGSSSASRNINKTSRDKGIIIEELHSDDEGSNNYPETGDEEHFHQKNSRSAMEPTVEHPDDDVDEVRKNKNETFRKDHNKVEPKKAGDFSFQTCRVTYGGIDGAYYASTRTRRIGADGVILEESKEADKTTGQATHRISRGIHDKGHSLMRKINSDGKVDTMQTLHNLDEDELAGFEEAWKGNNIGQLPGWKGGYNVHRTESSGRGRENGNHIWALPALEQVGRAGGFGSSNETRTNPSGRTKKIVRINIE